jgi:hypothetical protein
MGPCKVHSGKYAPHERQNVEKIILGAWVLET